MAIAYDNATQGSAATATSITFAHTCTGANLVLYVGSIGSTTSDLQTGVTYNGVAMTAIDKLQHTGGRWDYSWVLIAPAAGAHNVVVSASGSDYINASAASYTGARQSSQPPHKTKDSNGSASTLTGTIDTSSAPSTDNCWVLMFGQREGGAVGVGAGSTLRAGNTPGVIDGNGAKTPAGSVSLIVTTDGAGNKSIGYQMFSIAPAPIINSNFFALM